MTAINRLATSVPLSTMSSPKPNTVSQTLQAYGAMTRALMGVSERSRVVLAFEGGYDPRGVADCVVEAVAAMAEVAPEHAAQELKFGMITLFDTSVHY